MQGSTVDLDFSLDWSFGLCVEGLFSSALVQWIALDWVSYRRSVWVIHLWMTGLSWYLSHLLVVFIALWLVAAVIIVDCLL
ncbi:hypothetical protein Peur_004666 [Populus x canadensis]